MIELLNGTVAEVVGHGNAIGRMAAKTGIEHGIGSLLRETKVVKHNHSIGEVSIIMHAIDTTEWIEIAARSDKLSRCAVIIGAVNPQRLCPHLHTPVG